MASYVIGASDITVNDIKDINPAPAIATGHPLGASYVRLGKANGQQTPALHFTAGSTVTMPNTSDVKESERGGQLKKFIVAGLILAGYTSALTATGDSAASAIDVS